MVATFPNLLSPVQVGRLTVPNRVLVTAHTTNYSNNGLPTERDAHYYEERARGGAGMIVIGALRCHPTSMNAPYNIRAYDPAVVPAFQRISDAVHRHGSVVIGQVLHMGRQINPVYSRLPVWAPSPIPCPINKVVPHEMTRAEIREVIEHFALSAHHAKQGGMDGIEIHGAHGYLIQQFMSPWSNVRIDAYGGSLENRLRFVYDVIDAVRDAVGDDFTVGFRLSAEEFTDGGLDLAQMMGICQLLEATGKLNFLSVSQSNYNPTSFQTMIPDMYFGQAPYVQFAGAIKDKTDGIPVFTVARILDPHQADEIIASQAADMVGMTRAHIADPEIVRKARENRPDDIRLCIGCNQGCAHMIHQRQPMTCVQNPAVGYEDTRGVLPLLGKVKQPRHVMIVGGGPAGMEAAVTAAQRGHKVHLYEQSDRLGGQINTLVRVPERSDYYDVVRWREHMLEKLGVTVHLHTTITDALVREINPDVLLVATGSKPVTMPINGLDPAKALTVEDALHNPAQVGDNVLLLDKDGHYRATATAEYLAQRGKTVTLLTANPDVGTDIPKINLVGVNERFAKYGIRVLTHASITHADGDSIHYRQRGFVDHLAHVDTVVMALPRVANTQRHDALRQAAPDVRFIGDCLAPRRALDAIWDGHQAAWAI